MGERIISDNEIMVWLQRFIDKNGYSPSMREITEGLGYYSTSTVFARMSHLAENGYISWTPGKSRTIRILNRAEVTS